MLKGSAGGDCILSGSVADRLMLVRTVSCSFRRSILERNFPNIVSKHVNDSAFKVDMLSTPRNSNSFTLMWMLAMNAVSSSSHWTGL